MYFIQPLYSKTCRSFTFPSAAAGAACGAPSTIPTQPQRDALSRRRRRPTSAAATAAAPLPFPSPPGFRGPPTHRHPWNTTVVFSTLHLPSALSFTFQERSSPSPPLVFSFFRSPRLQEFYQLPSSLLDVHPADFISPYTLHLLLIPFLPCASQSSSRSRDTPSSVSSLRSFVTTQRAHLIRIIRAISVFSTRPLRSSSFFFFSVLVPPRTRVLSKQQASAAPVKWDFGR